MIDKVMISLSIDAIVKFPDSHPFDNIIYYVNGTSVIFMKRNGFEIYDIEQRVLNFVLSSMEGSPRNLSMLVGIFFYGGQRNFEVCKETVAFISRHRIELAISAYDSDGKEDGEVGPIKGPGHLV